MSWIDQKYGRITISNKDKMGASTYSSNSADNHEPVVLLRGQDAFLVPLLQRYRNMHATIEDPAKRSSSEFIENLDGLIADIQQWQSENPTKLAD